MVDNILGRVHFTNQSEIMLHWGNGSKMKFTFYKIKEQKYDTHEGEKTAYGFYARKVDGGLREIVRFHPEKASFQIFLDPSTNMQNQTLHNHYTEAKLKISKETAHALLDHEKLQDLEVEDNR